MKRERRKKDRGESGAVEYILYNFWWVDGPSLILAHPVNWKSHIKLRKFKLGLKYWLLHNHYFGFFCSHTRSSRGLLAIPPYDQQAVASFYFFIFITCFMFVLIWQFDEKVVVICKEDSLITYENSLPKKKIIITYENCSFGRGGGGVGGCGNFY